MLDNHFSELATAKDVYHTAVPTIEKRSAMSALDKMLFESGRMNYETKCYECDLIEYGSEFYRFRESEILHDLSRIVGYIVV